MFFAASKVFAFLTAPSNFLALLIVAGAVLLVTRRRRLGAWLLGAGLVLLVVAGLSPLGVVLTRVLEERFPPWDASRGAPTGFIILGGTVQPAISIARGTPALDDSAERLTVVPALARRFPTARFIFSGGSAALFGGPAEADVALDLFESFGVPRERVAVDANSRNTEENALFSKALAMPRPGDRWVVVTSSLHMPRAIGAFRAAGFDVEAYPVDWHTGAASDAFGLFPTVAAGLGTMDRVAHEYVGLLAYWLSGRSSELFPGPRKPASLAFILRDGALRVRGELPARHDDHHGDRGDDQRDRADEPAEIAEREEERALAAVEMAARGLEQAGGASHVRLGGGQALLRRRRHGAVEDGHVVEQPVGPGELEERVDEDHREADDLDLPQAPRGRDAQRQRAQDVEHLIRRAQEGERAADRDERGRGEERGAVLERRHDLHVGDARLALEHAPDPDLAEPVHARVQRGPAARRAFDQHDIAGPGDGEPADGDGVERRQESHGIAPWFALMLPSPRRSCHLRAPEREAMPQHINVHASDLIAAAEREIDNLPVADALALHGRDDVQFVDIRDIRELDREGKMPGAFHCPRGMLEFWLDPASPYHKDVFSQDKRFVFFCAAGSRSALAAQTAQHMGLRPVAHIKGGFGAWKAAGGPVES